MALKAFILAALLAFVCSSRVENKDISIAILDKLIDGLRAEGKLQGRQHEAITALREEFPDLITSVRNDNKNGSSDQALYTKIADFLKSQNVDSTIPPANAYVPTSGGVDGYVPPSGGGGSNVPPSGGGGYGQPSGGGGSYVQPNGGGGSYVQPSGGGGYVQPSGGGGGYVQPSGGGGGYVQPSGGEGGYVQPSGGEGYVQPSGGGGYVQPSGGGGYVQPSGGGGGYVQPENIKAEIFSIMDTIFAIMKYQGLIYDTDNPVWTLIDRGFDLLADFVRRNVNRNKHEGKCPYSYDVSGELCLAVDLNALGLTWYEARLYCQVVKGGELAIFKDANQLRDMQRYLRSFDKKYRYSYFIGASDVKKENYWEFINGEPVPLGTPYWGRTDYDGTQNPSGGEDSDFAILYGKDFFYLADVSDEEADDIKVVPLCQYFHGRGLHDHNGYHAENGLYHDKGDNLGHKLTNILALSSSVSDPDSIEDNGYKTTKKNHK